MFLIGLWLSAAQKRSEARIKAGADRKTEKRANTRRRRAILWLGILSQGGVLFFLKFYDCVASHLNLWTASEVLPVKNLILPLGISFYTLEAISYLVDVYYRKIEAERNIGRMALFLSFFPIIMEGPICRYGELARPLWEGKQLTYRNLTFGAQRLLWGLFKKWIIADRLSPLVSTLFNHPDGYQGGVMALAGILYTLQLYADFSGCIDMTIGTGEMFGLTLPENFRQPFFRKEPVGVLAPVAYYAGRVVQGLHFLSTVSDQRYQKAGQICAQEAGQALWPDRADADSALCCLAVQWRVAWHRLDVPVLWYVLLCTNRSGRVDRAVGGLRNRKTGH